MKRKIIIAGSEGVIGKSVVKFFGNDNETEIVKIDKILGNDLSNENEVKEIFYENKDTDYIVNLFAINDHVEGKSGVSINSISLKSLEDYCMVNLISLFSVCRQFEHMCNNPKGIINFGSLYGVRSPKKQIYLNNEKHIGYTITKHGVVGLTRHLATHFENTRCNCLLPGGVETQIQDDYFKEKYSANVPMGRLLNVKELNGIIDLLCSDNSSYINGALIPIDGGWTAW